MGAEVQAPPTEGLVSQLLRLDDRFWIVNTMEMLERLAYYGVRATVPIYMLLPASEGGPGLDHVQKGSIFAAWAAVQSLLPMFTGGLADRYGHKNTIVVAILVKVLGYIGMAVAPSYPLFFLACLGLATGTALFKPGVQGTLAASLRGSEASLGWGIFYQLVNVGGFIGPSLAGVLRLMDWTWVFLVCAATVSLNLLWLPFYTDATEERRSSAAPSDPSPWRALAAATPRGRPRGWAIALLAGGAAWSGAALAGLWLGLAGLHPSGIGALVGFLAALTALGLTLSGRALGAAAALAGVGAAGALAAGLMGGAALAADGLSGAGLDPLAGALRFADGAFLSWGAPGLAAPLLRFVAAPARFTAPTLRAADIVVLSIVGLFSPRVLWFCLIFSGFWLSFNQVFDLLPVTIDDWVDSGDLIADLGAALRSPAVVGAGALAAALTWGAPLALSAALVADPARVRAPLTAARLGLIGLLGALAALPLAGALGPAAALAAVLGAGAAAAGAARAHGRMGVLGVGLVGLLAAGVGSYGPLSSASGALTQLAESGGQVNPEWLLNVNSALIITGMVFVAQASARLPTLWNIILGMCLATLGGALAGTATSGWGCVAGLTLFSLGEMLSSPKKLEYLASLAPRGQEGLFMGYANIPVAIGWIAGSVLVGDQYEEGGDRANLARRYLTEQLGVAEAAQLPREEALAALAAHLQVGPEAARDLLREVYDPTAMWWELAGWGLISVLGMIAYDRALRIFAARGRAGGASGEGPSNQPVAE
ncbi:MAG: MFS transporter [Deltaproteobacteria bacterium]|nr:MFS transporter [Deltaproteobacteria bacterium]